jgi:hypothetical protein
MAHWPSSAGPVAHFALAIQRAMPLGSPLTQTLGGTNTRRRRPRSSPGASGARSKRHGLVQHTINALLGWRQQAPARSKPPNPPQEPALPVPRIQHQQARAQKLRLQGARAFCHGKPRQEFKTQIQRFGFKSPGPTSARQ